MKQEHTKKESTSLEAAWIRAVKTYSHPFTPVELNELCKNALRYLWVKKNVITEEGSQGPSLHLYGGSGLYRNNLDAYIDEAIAKKETTHV